jgi:glyoxylase-like metal-dependent hydrolase (beta-lactamase superfamily II)
MRKFIGLTLVCLVALAAAPRAQQGDALKAAADALNVASMKTVQVTGWGATFSIGRDYFPNDPWPRVWLRNYTALINYDTASMRVELHREMGAVMPLGGGGPFTGEQRQIQVVSGNDAWNVPAGGGSAAAQPQPGAAVERMLALWATPHGFVKAAMANNATMRSARGGTEVSFTVGGKYKMTGFINSLNLVERVQTWIDQPLVGDLLVETVYSVYRNFNGVLFPSRIVQSQGGHPTLEVHVVSVEPNAAVNIAVPDNVRGAKPPAVRVDAEQLAEGVYYFTGGGANTLAIEMRDHIVLVDTPTNEERVLAVFAKAKELMQNKPVRFVISTHDHWDHAGGIRTAMDAGATIVMHEMYRPFFEKVATNPHTVAPDRLSVSKRAPKFQTVGDSGRLTDGSRTIEIYNITGNVHAAGLLMVYLPKEKIVAEADAPGQAEPLVSVMIPSAAALYDNIQRRKLDVAIIAPLHGAHTMTVAELLKFMGRSPASN